MALKVVSMNELKLEVLREPERTGESVAEVCRRRGISRASFYRYRRRYLEEGVAGLEPRSKRPRVSPGRIDPLLEAEICELRRRHPRFGAHRIRAELRRAGIEAPGVATVHRALRRNHLVAPQPPRRRRARKRFERESLADRRDRARARLGGASLGRRLLGRPRPPVSARARLRESHGRRRLGLLQRRGGRLRAAAAAPLRQPPELHRAPVRARGRLRAQVGRAARSCARSLPMASSASAGAPSTSACATPARG
ncbi:MAG: helix-turn-helix domain-containing protein [Gaiellaceae bacterium]